MASFVSKLMRQVAPGMMAKREIERMKLDLAQKARGLTNSGYGDHGASTSRKSLKAFNPVAGDAKSDILDNLPLLRARSRALYQGGALASGALKSIRTNVVGTGLRLKPTPDSNYLGLTPERAAELNRNIKREWEIWSESKDCDAAGIHNFSGLQQLAFMSELMSGDAFALLYDKEVKHSRYKLRVKLVEADRCDTPARGMNGMDDEKIKRISSGVETDEDGLVTAYWFSKAHPQAFSVGSREFERVEVRGAESGRRHVLHLMTAERPDQLRGVPLLASVIEQFKQLERFTDAELTASVIAAMYTVFITMNENSDPDEFLPAAPATFGANPTGEPIPRGSDEVGLGNGLVNFLEPGEQIQIAESKRPNVNFDPFVMANIRQIGSGIEVPYEIMLKNFTSSYSASRGALLEAGKVFKMRRSWLSSDFCQPVYEEFFAEAVLAGRIDAPGFFDDELIRRAYVRAEWHGPSYGLLDPLKEVAAAQQRVANGYSTAERETAELTGGDYEVNIQRLAEEKAMRERYGVETVGMPIPLMVADLQNGGSDNDSDDEI